MTSFKIFTLFPEVIQNYVANNAPIKRGIEKGIVSVGAVNIRDYSKQKHKKVDDIVYGGGPGMLLAPAPIVDSVRAHRKPETRIFFMDPRGKKLDNQLAKEIAREKEVFLICGRYEGFDQRAIDILGGEMISLGDFILTGGELAALAVLDSSTRFMEGSLDDFESQEEESFNKGLLEHPQYTRPPVFEGMAVPEELLSGHHKRILEWKIKNSINISIKNRPDLLKLLNLNSIEQDYLKNAIKELYCGNDKLRSSH